jgi:hypothetical protein
MHLTNDDLVALLEGVSRDLKVQWCGSLANTSRDIVVRTVAGAVPSTVVTSLTNWDASQVSADTYINLRVRLIIGVFPCRSSQSP